MANIIIGKNNSGKSNILRFISELDSITTKQSFPFNKLDHFGIDYDNKISFSLQFSKSKNLGQAIQKVHREIKPYLENLDEIWVEFDYSNQNKIFNISPGNLHWFENVMPKGSELNKLSSKVVGQSSPENLKLLFNMTQNFLIPSNDKIYILENFRRIRTDGLNGTKGTRDYEKAKFNGSAYIKLLGELKTPRSENQREKIKFKKIESFISDIMGIPNLKIDISSDQSELQLENNGIIIPLENLGTGIHQLLLMAISVTINDNYIFCIEEPETGLHPEMQRKFIKYLIEKTQNQYFITTHSNIFMNEQGVDVYHVSHDGQSSKVEKVISSNDKNKLLNDLGFHASDLLQANFILWVEGPSDRIYINHWLKSKAPDLIEGIHYSIVFYGGKLLSHLTIDDLLIEDFIKLKRINRNCGIYIDSDKKTEMGDINDTKKRLLNEFSNQNYFHWLSKGREIENYLKEIYLRNAAKDLEKELPKSYKYGEFEDVVFNDNKIALARKICEYPADLNVLDLGSQISNLVTAIKNAN